MNEEHPHTFPSNGRTLLNETKRMPPALATGVALASARLFPTRRDDTNPEEDATDIYI